MDFINTPDGVNTVQNESPALQIDAQNLESIKYCRTSAALPNTIYFKIEMQLRNNVTSCSWRRHRSA
jgi:hypothetical protein